MTLTGTIAVTAATMTIMMMINAARGGTAAAMKASARMTSTEVDAGFEGGSKVAAAVTTAAPGAAEMAAVGAMGTRATTVGAARATARMTSAVAVVECGERRIAVVVVVVVGVAVAVGVGPFKR